MELLPFVDILKVFNNPINEEQAWAVCYQCAHFLQRNPSQEFYQDVYDSGIHSIWVSRHGDVLLRKGPSDPNGSGKGPPHQSPSSHENPTPSSSTTTTTTTSGSSSWRTTTTPHHRGRSHVLISETDAVQALGTAIFEALDYGIDQSEERQLSPELEAMIVTMTSSAGDSSLDYDPEAASNGDDEGIEKDADVETRCSVLDVIKLCVRHLSSKQDASHHYKAVCRALATEAGELFTFLDKVSAGKEQLSQTEDEDAKRLDELQRADWACLWVQVMRSLRQGVRLKKVEHVHLPPLEYELTPFEMILEDIRSRRYTLTKIMVNGDIPHKVKNDAHAVILNFIRSRPPLKKVDERKLKPKPPAPPDPHELLLNDIRARPKLKPVRDGKLVVEKPDRLGSLSLSTSPSGEEARSGARTPVKRVIKPDFNLLLNNSFEESSDDEDRSSNNSPGTPEYRQLLRHHHHQQQQQHQLYPRSDSLSMTPPPQHSWQRAVTRESLLREPNLQQNQQGRPSRLQRRHTITICEAPPDHQVALKELPVLQEEEEEQQPSPVRDTQCSGGSSTGQARPAVALPRTSHSDNDLQGTMTSTMTINLRQGNPNLVRRASFEHRRSLTSQGSVGLTSIPEQEDDGRGPGSAPLARAKSQEQCPPPNPSPPCKGRAKAGLAMVGMKPSGGPYHPSIHRPHAATTVAGVPTTSPAPAPTASMQHAQHGLSYSHSPYGFSRAGLQSQHATSISSSSSASFSKPLSSHMYSSNTSPPSSSSSSSTPSPSHLPLTPGQQSNISNLDRSFSSQSPAYMKSSHRTAPQNGAMPDEDAVGRDGNLSRWRASTSAPHKNNTNSSQSTDYSNTRGYPSPSPRRWAAGLADEGHAGDEDYPQYPLTVGAGYYPEDLSHSLSRQKRLSLDAGMSMYYEEALREDGPESLPASPYLGRDTRVVRKTSVGLDRGVKGRTGFRRLKTPEEEERVTRWRALQEDDRQARLGQQYQTHAPTPVRRSGASALTPPTPPESTDVLQQRMAGEEERFERWRRLEDGTGSHPLLDHLNPRSPLASPNLNLSRSASAHVSSPRNRQSQGADPPDPRSFVTPLPGSTSDPSPLHDSLSLPKRWQNPVECLSLTLEEVTHIRSVLTKAELESLMSHADLYQQVAKNKLCFTCKTTRFALFGEWGTKCKFCKRTVCSKCLRKMNVPADHFRNIPVYALSPAPLTQEMQEFIQDFIRGAPTPSVPATRDHSPVRQSSSTLQPQASPSSSSSSSMLPAAQQLGLGPGKALQRSQSALVTMNRPKLSSTGAATPSLSSSIKGPVMAICCDCKGMVMEIIRATRASLTLLSSQEGRASLSQTASSSSSAAPSLASSSSTTSPASQVSLNPSARHYLAKSKPVWN